MAQLKRLISEIHRRSLWQVLGVYAVSAWVIFQVVVALYEGIGLPDWVPGTALVLLLIGLPIVLATAFVQEGAPGLGRERGRAGAIERDPAVLTAADELSDDIGGKRHTDAHAATAAPEPAAPAGARRFFTWNRAITGGVLAFAVLGVAATGFMGMRSLGIGPAATLVSSGAMGEDDRAVLADFDNATSDPLMGETVTEALRVDLDRSTVLGLVSPAGIQDALRRMERPEDTRLDAETAREIALRDGHKAVITGEVRQVGSQYLLNARVVAAADGEVLASFRETAEGEDDVIPAIDRLSAAIREKVGESLRSIRAEPPLPQTTTASLTALQRFTQGVRVFFRGDQLGAVGHMEEALEADSTFAAAHSLLAIALGNLGIDPERERRATAKAFEYRDRLTEDERHWVAGNYYTDLGEIDRAIDEFEAVIAAESAELQAGAWNNAALLYRERRRFDRAAELLRASIDAGKGSDVEGANVAIPYANLVDLLMNDGRVEEARAALAEGLEHAPDHRVLHGRLIHFAGSEGDYATVDSLAREHHERYGDVVEGRLWARYARAYAAAIRGRLEDAHDALSDVWREAEAGGWASTALAVARRRALADGVARQDPARALRVLDEAFARFPPDSLPADNVPLPALAYTLARLGALDRARALIDHYRAEIPRARRDVGGDRISAAEALIAIQEGRLDDAEAALEELARRNYCDFCWLPLHGMLAERRGRTDEAIATYERYIEQPWLQRLDDDAEHYVFVLHRLADLHEQQGDRAAAARYLARFVELWQDADADLQHRVREAERRLDRLTGEGG